MSRTTRKDKNGVKRTEYGKKQEGHYKCRCEYCTCEDKKKLIDKAIDSTIVEGIEEHDTRYDD